MSRPTIRPTRAEKRAARAARKRCHAADRLAERYGISLTGDQCRQLGRFILSSEAQAEPEFLVRANGRRRDGISRWWINFEWLTGRTQWALAVVDDRRQHIITFLPAHHLWRSA